MSHKSSSACGSCPNQKLKKGDDDLSVPSAAPAEKEETPVKQGQYSAEIKSQVVQFARHNTAGVASKQFNIARSTVVGWIKQAGETPGVSEKSGRYTPAFKAQVLEFSASNTNADTRRRFNMPESTLRGWIREATKAGVDKSYMEDKMLLISDVDDCITRSSFGSVRKSLPMISNQEGIDVVADIANINKSSSISDEICDSVVPSVELNSDKIIGVVEASTPTSKVSRYPDSFRRKAVKYGEQQGWKAAAGKFGVSTNSVCVWARRMGIKSSKKVPDETKEKIIKYSLLQNSWRAAAEKFGVSPNTVSFWGKKAGHKLRSGGRNRKEVACGESELSETVCSLDKSRSAEEFGMDGSFAVGQGDSSPKVKESSLDDGKLTKEKVKVAAVKFGSTNGWTAAGAKYGVHSSTVYRWSKARDQQECGEQKNDSDVVFSQELREQVVKSAQPVKSSVRTRKSSRMSDETQTSDYTCCAKHCDSQGSATKLKSKKMRKEKWALNTKSCTNSAVNPDSPVGTNISECYEPNVSEKEVESEVLPAHISLADRAVPPLSQLSTDDVFSPKGPGNKVRCEACGRNLAADETLKEHVVCVHMTIEGLCDICGEDSRDFLEHFKIHLCYQSGLIVPPNTVKLGCLDIVDVNQNHTDCMEKVNSVKEESTENVKDGERVINPFYCSS
eukprot:GFUD01023452.1.p1 GENE.GFUD01023452.1~~GFUD01023452.1.p1  ORF type:complete len:674 (-),score=165.11 GFUD01023452.1:81-2102(-)